MTLKKIIPCLLLALSGVFLSSVVHAQKKKHSPRSTNGKVKFGKYSSRPTRDCSGTGICQLSPKTRSSGGSSSQRSGKSAADGVDVKFEFTWTGLDDTCQGCGFASLNMIFDSATAISDAKFPAGIPDGGSYTFDGTFKFSDPGETGVTKDFEIPDGTNAVNKFVSDNDGNRKLRLPTIYKNSAGQYVLTCPWCPSARSTNKPKKKK